MTGLPCMVITCGKTKDRCKVVGFIILMMYCVVVVDFFNRINVIYGVVCDFCTEQSCPTMSGGGK